MATIAIGDIHGNLAALDDILGQVHDQGDHHNTIVFLGDYIDRGPHTKECVDAIIRFQREVAAKVVCLLGNHEDWFLRSLRDHGRHSWLLGMEAYATIGSYSADAAQTMREAASAAGARLYMGHYALPYDAFFDSVPQEHIRFFEELCLYHQTEDCLCTHGGLDPRVAGVQEQARDALIWGAGSFPDGYEGTEVVVYGHQNNATLNAKGWAASDGCRAHDRD
jgi:serine/threonine protein phosphatase 1